MRITRSTLRRLIAEESARLLREAAEEEEEGTVMDEAERGKKGKKQDDADCLYVLHGGRGTYYYTAPCGLSEREASKKGHNVSADVADGEDWADPLSLYDWLGRHDEITAVYDFESAGGEVSKDDYMAQLEAVGREEGLFADDEFINEDEDLEEGAFPEEIEGVYGAEPPEFDETDEDPSYFSDEFEDSAEDPNYFDTDYDDESDSDDSWMDIETGEDDVPYGAADVALRKGRGHRTDEGHDPLDSGDYEGSREYPDDEDLELKSVDYWGDTVPYDEDDSEGADFDAAAEDEMAGEEEDWSWAGRDSDADLGRTSRFPHTAKKYRETGDSDPGIDPADRTFGGPRGLDETDDSQGDDEDAAPGTDWSAAEVRSGRHAEGPYGGGDSDTLAWHRQQKRSAHLPPRAFSDDKSGRGMHFRHSGEDVSMGYDDEGAVGDNLSESRWAKLAGILKG